MKKRILRHPDHGKRHNTPSPNNQVIAAHLEELLTPAIFNQQAYLNNSGSISSTVIYPVDEMGRGKFICRLYPLG